MTAPGKKTAKGAKKTIKPDIDKPGKSAPPATSKPVLVSNRPLLKDPMVVDEAVVSKKEDADKEELAHSTGPKLKPIEEPPKADDAKKDQPTEDEQPMPQAEAEANDEPTTRVQEDAQPQQDAKPAPKEKEETKPTEQTRHDADVQKLIDSRKYELPINAVEKRKTKRFVVLGVLLAILLILTWADVALDAGLIQVDGVKPVTHFFSN